MITGYKWTKGKQDGKFYIVTLHCNNEFPDGFKKGYDGKSFYSTDCVVYNIEDEDGKPVKEVDGHAFQDFFYYTGQEIKGERIYFVHEKQLLTNPSLLYKLFPHLMLPKQIAALEKWNKAGDMALHDPLFMFSPDSFYLLRERYFWDLGGTLEELSLIDM